MIEIESLNEIMVKISFSIVKDKIKDAQEAAGISHKKIVLKQKGVIILLNMY